jgi:two-component system, cell cycle response regulator
MSRVLIADDDRISCTLLGSLLTKWGYQTEIVYNGVDAQRELLKPDAPRLAILDWMMPGLDGTQVIQALRAIHRESYTYVLLLTSKGQKEDILEGLDAGADDYLKKPFDAQELRARLRVGGRILDLERRLMCALETAEYRATHDFLSGIYNRAAILELLNREASRCARADQEMSVLMVDVDHFKVINDTYGHLVGDQVIKQLTLRMGAVLRPYDSIGRFGGEEFLVLTPNCTLSEAMMVAERLRFGVARDKMAIGQFAIPVTVSVGVSTIKESVADINLALQAADLALYEAKNKGRNRVECRISSELAAPSLPPPSLGECDEKDVIV